MVLSSCVRVAFPQRPADIRSLFLQYAVREAPGAQCGTTQHCNDLPRTGASGRPQSTDNHHGLGVCSGTRHRRLFHADLINGACPPEYGLTTIVGTLVSVPLWELIVCAPPHYAMQLQHRDLSLRIRSSIAPTVHTRVSTRTATRY